MKWISTSSSSVSLFALLLAGTVPCSLFANPVGGTLVAGTAAINSAGNTLTVNQTTDKAVIDWRGFDIAAGETTNFKQPSNNSVTLNRVNSSTPSMIDGVVNANGNLVIVNQNGVLFGKNSEVNVNSLLVTTADIDNAKFMAGRMEFDKLGKPDAAIENRGAITAKQAGLVGLVAPNVLNSGTIMAKLGTVHLASGDAVTVDFYGDGLLEVQASPALQAQLVENTGRLKAEGGTIAMTAAAAGETVNSLIQVGGELDATTVGSKNGAIYIYAEGSNAVPANRITNKNQKSGTSTVLVDGALDASGRHPGQHGGDITVTGDNVALLSGALMDASGSDGTRGTVHDQTPSAWRVGAAGGSIQIGGDYLGGGTTPTARNLYVAPDTMIFNDALRSGDAGRSIFWSDGSTEFHGIVFARALGGRPADLATASATEGGAEGDGGFVETSGHGQLTADGHVDLTASKGRIGTYLLDPTNISIYGNVTPTFTSSAGITDSTALSLSGNLKLWLDASDTNSVTLNYKSLGTTVTGGTVGNNIITVGSASGLVVGERIQLGGSTHSYAASVNDNASSSGIYTITAISGTTVTLDASLATNVTGAALYGGYVTQLADKSGNGNNVAQATPSAMPLWLSNGQNGIGAMNFNGSSMFLNGGNILNLGTDNQTTFVMAQYANASAATDTIYAKALYGSQAGRYSMLTDTVAGHGRGAFMARSTSVLVYPVASNTSTSPSLFGTVFQRGTGLYYLANGAVSAFAASTADSTNYSTTNSFLIGAYNNNTGTGAQTGYFHNGMINELVFYNTALSANAQALVNQYQAAKWGVALTGPGIIGSEAGLTGAEAQKAMASTQAGATTDGYSVFSAAYLNSLSQTSNIILKAGNNINLDMQGTSLVLAAGKNITLTAGNQIVTASSGDITTAQSSGSGGNITLNAANGILFNHAFALNSGGGNIALNNAVTLNNALTANAGTGTLTFGSTVNGSHNLTASAGTFSFASPVGGTTPLAAVSLTSVNSLALPSINATNITARTTGATADISIASGRTLTVSGSGTPLTLIAKRDFVNASTTPMSVTGGARWLVYASSSTGSALNGLTASFTRYSCAYGGSCPAFAATGNGFLYSGTPILTVAPATIGNLTYGDTAPSLVGYNYNMTGYLGSDSGSDSVSGSLTGTTTYTAGSDTGIYNINYASGTLASSLGYGFTYANNASAFTVAARTATASLIGAITKIYDGTTDATLTSANYNLNGLYNADAIGISNTSGTYSSKDVGNGLTVTVNGLTLTGAKASNYTLSSTSTAAAIGSITPATLTGVITANDKTYDGTTNATLATRILSGTIFSTDSLNLALMYTAADFNSKDVATASAVTATGLSLTGSAASNYQLSSPTAFASARIMKKSLNITADDQTIIYGTPVPYGSLAYDGFVTGESVSSLTVVPFIASAQNGLVDAGTYGGNYTVSGGVSGNYSFHYAAGDLTVQPQPAAIPHSSRMMTPQILTLITNQTSAPVDPGIQTSSADLAASANIPAVPDRAVNGFDFIVVAKSEKPLKPLGSIDLEMSSSLRQQLGYAPFAN
jgi:filamentous hemagglutinin family protein